MSNFITIHGIDGVGKTTAAVTVASAMHHENGATYTYEKLLEVEPSFLAQERRIKEELADDQEESTLQKSTRSKLAQSVVIREALDNGISVVRDRWYVDVLASNSFLGEDVSSAPEILKPDLAVVLLCNEQERMRRIHNRANPTEDDLIPKVQGSRAYYFENFLLEHTQSLCSNFMTLETANNQPASIADKIMKGLHGE